MALFLSTLLVASCSQDNLEVNNTTETTTNQQGVTVGMALTGVVNPAKTRTTTFTTNNNGFPTPVKPTQGKVPVLCIFKSSDPTQPITKVVINWDVEADGTIALKPSTTFQLAAGSDLDKEWYVMGIIGGTAYNGNNVVTADGQTAVTNLSINGFMGHTTPGQNIEADVPFIFGWRKLNSSQSARHLESKKVVQFMPMGTFVRVKVTNGMNTAMRYNGFRLISSSPVKGDFVLSDDAIRAKTESNGASTITDTDDANLRATDALYSNLLTFTGNTRNSQRIAGRGFPTTTAFAGNAQTSLYYNDYTFTEGATTLSSNGTDGKYLTVWMMPQPQIQTYYQGVEGNYEWNDRGNTSVGERTEVYKTQFILHSSQVNSSDPAINMLPIMGTTDEFKSGDVDANVYQGRAIFRYTPLHHMAKTDNLVPNENVASAPQSATKLYTVTEMQNGKTADGSEKKPDNYLLPNRNYWQALIGYWGFGNGNQFNSYRGVLVPTSFGGVKKTFMTYTSGVGTIGRNPTYALCLSKVSDKIENPRTGQLLYGAHTKSGHFQSIDGFDGIENDPRFPAADYPMNNSNNLQFAMRASFQTGGLQIEARYLGSNCVLDICDISNSIFWESIGSTTTDLTRTLPMSGYHPLRRENPDNGGSGNYFPLEEVGNVTQYWINERQGGAGYADFNSAAARTGRSSEAGNETYFAYSFIGSGAKTFTGAGYFNPVYQSSKTHVTKEPTMKLPVRLIRRQPFNN